MNSKRTQIETNAKPRKQLYRVKKMGGTQTTIGEERTWACVIEENSGGSKRRTEKSRRQKSSIESNE